MYIISPQSVNNLTRDPSVEARVARQNFSDLIISFPGSIVTELARYIHLDLYSAEVGGRGEGQFFIALFHVLGHVDHFKRIKKSV